MELIEKFYAYLLELEQSYTRLGDLLRQKLEAVERFDVNRLDEIMKEEQVYVLLSKGFDANLRSYREKLGLRGEHLSQVIDQLPEEERPRFTQQHKRLQTVLAQVKDRNEKCQLLIQERLHSLDKSIKELNQAEQGTYGKAGDGAGRTGEGPHLFTKSI